MLAQPRKRYPSVQVCEDEDDGFREGLNPSYGLSKYGLEPVKVEQTDHYELMREFCADPAGFVEAVVEE
jgi:hypothetical protein